MTHQPREDSGDTCTQSLRVSGSAEGSPVLRVHSSPAVPRICRYGYALGERGENGRLAEHNSATLAGIGRLAESAERC